MSSTLDGIDVPPADASNTLRRCKAFGEGDQLQNVCGVEGCMNAPVMNTNEGGPGISSGCPEWMHHPIDICDYHCDGGEDYWSMVYYDAPCGKWRELPEELRTARRNVEMAQEEFQRARKKYKIHLE